MDDDPATLINGLAERQHGVVATYQLRELGITRSRIHRLTTHHGWEPLTDVVLRRHGSHAGTEQKVAAGVLDCGHDAFLGFQSSAGWWGHLGSPATDPVHSVTTARSRRRSRLAKVHLIQDVDPRWVTVLNGVRVARPELTALHLFAVLHEERAERVVDALWGLRLFSGASLSTFLLDMGRRGRTGTAALRRYFDARGVGYVPPATGLESRTRQIAERAGVPLRSQVDSGGDQWSGRVDFRHPTLPLIVEVQSEKFHTALTARADDAARLQRLRDDGFVVIEITDDDLWTRPWRVVDKLRAAVKEASIASTTRNRLRASR